MPVSEHAVDYCLRAESKLVLILMSLLENQLIISGLLGCSGGTRSGIQTISCLPFSNLTFTQTPFLLLLVFISY